jgi:hypothetical protein
MVADQPAPTLTRTSYVNPDADLEAFFSFAPNKVGWRLRQAALDVAHSGR